MRYRARADENQKAIVLALRQAGASVLVLSALGKGCPDLLVGKDGRNLLMEVKNPAKVQSQRVLTPDEQEFFDSWRGQVIKIETVEDALKCL